MTKRRFEIIILGGGPIGLYFAALCTRGGLDFLLLEATDVLGGQIRGLYPEKEILDLPQRSAVIGKNYLKELIAGIDVTKIIFNEKITAIQEEKDGVIIKSEKYTYFAKYLVIATGLGFYEPRRLGLDHEHECRNILTSLKDPTMLRDQRVVIFGGGDTALDWARCLSGLTKHCSLVHRRKEFRGDAATIRDCWDLHVYLPYVPHELIVKDGLCEKVIIRAVDESERLITLPVDWLLISFGSVPSRQSFGLPGDGIGIKVDKDMKASEHVFVIGDAAAYEGKKRRLAPGNKEAEKVFELITKSNKEKAAEET